MTDTIIRNTKGKIIYHKNSHGEWRWEYNDMGKCTYTANLTKGFEAESYNEYDANGRLIHHKPSKGNEQWLKYNDYGQLVYQKDSDSGVGGQSREAYLEYDDTGKCAKTTIFVGGVEWKTETYNDKK